MSTKRHLDVAPILNGLGDESDSDGPAAKTAEDQLAEMFANPDAYPTAPQDLIRWFKNPGYQWLRERRPALASAIHIAGKQAATLRDSGAEESKTVRDFLIECLRSPDAHPAVVDAALHRMRLFHVTDREERRRAWEGMRPWLDLWLARPAVTSNEARRLLDDLTDDTQAFWLYGGEVIRSIVRLAEVMPKMPKWSFDHHFSGPKNDFSFWIGGTLRDFDLAKGLVAAKNQEEMAEMLAERVRQLRRCLNPAPDYSRMMRVLPSVTAIAGNLAVDWMAGQLGNGTPLASAAVILAISLWDDRSVDPPDGEAFPKLYGAIMRRLMNVWRHGAPADISGLDPTVAESYPAWCVEALANLVTEDRVAVIAPVVAEAFGDGRSRDSKNSVADTLGSAWAPHVGAVLVGRFGPKVLGQLAPAFAGHKERFETYRRNVFECPALKKSG